MARLQCTHTGRDDKPTRAIRSSESVNFLVPRLRSAPTAGFPLTLTQGVTPPVSPVSSILEPSFTRESMERSLFLFTRDFAVSASFRGCESIASRMKADTSHPLTIWTQRRWTGSPLWPVRQDCLSPHSSNSYVAKRRATCGRTRPFIHQTTADCWLGTRTETSWLTQLPIAYSRSGYGTIQSKKRAREPQVGVTVLSGGGK